MEQELATYVTKRGHQAVAVSGFKFRLDKNQQNSKRWKCAIETCKARCTTDKDMKHILAGHFEHNHDMEGDERKVKVKEVQERCKKNGRCVNQMNPHQRCSKKKSETLNVCLKSTRIYDGPFIGKETNCKKHYQRPQSPISTSPLVSSGNVHHVGPICLNWTLGKHNARQTEKAPLTIRVPQTVAQIVIGEFKLETYKISCIRIQFAAKRRFSFSTGRRRDVIAAKRPAPK